MAERTGIQFTHRTFSPWVGCTEVSPGCEHCYAARSTPARVHGVKWGKGEPRRKTIDWTGPKRWNRKPWACVACGEPTTIVPGSGGECPKCGGMKTERTRLFFSLGDPFDEEVGLDLFTDFLQLIFETRELDWYLFTKRIQRARGRLRDAAAYAVASGTRSKAFASWLRRWESGACPPVNVWLIASTEDQTRLRQRVQPLLAFPAAVRGISIEPMLGPVDLRGTPGVAELDWIVVGGESHDEPAKARPCRVEWIESVVVQACELRVPVFVKQMGSRAFVNERDVFQWSPFSNMLQRCPDPDNPAKMVTRLVMRHPKGGDPTAWPEHLRLLNTPTSLSRDPEVLP